MAEKHAVFRSDLMSGTDVAADLVSLRFYNGTTSSATTADVDNCVIALLGEFESTATKTEREIRKASAAADDSDLKNCVVIATPEVMYDERKKNLDEFYNEAGTICRGYRLRQGNIFSVTAEAFASSPASVAIGTALGIGANGKIATSVGNGKTTLGYLRAVETTKRYTYYVIEVA